MRHLTTLAIAVVISSGPVASQDIFSNPKNLEVLPKNISPLELRDTMRGFTAALGVRCDSCHLGEPGQSLREIDFVDDSRDLKAVARQMLRMTAGVNQQLEGLPNRDAMKVQCVTCHRGVQIPRTTEDELSEADTLGGSSAIVARYRELREKYYGTHSYDFNEGLLSTLARSMIKEKRLADARELVQLNLEFYPDSWASRSTLAEIHFQEQDWEKAHSMWTDLLKLKLDQGSRSFIERRMEELKTKLTN